MEFLRIVAKILHAFNTTAKKYGEEISAPKTKMLVTSKDPIRCKSVVDNTIIEQVIFFPYLGIDITSNQDGVSEVRIQVNKAIRISGGLNEII